MTQTTYTPGPWDWQDNRLVGDLNGDGVSVSFHNPDNARLIAAAPDLLAALSDIVASSDANCGDSLANAIETARAAITKATKEQASC